MTVKNIVFGVTFSLLLVVCIVGWYMFPPLNNVDKAMAIASTIGSSMMIVVAFNKRANKIIK